MMAKSSGPMRFTRRETLIVKEGLTAKAEQAVGLRSLENKIRYKAIEYFNRSAAKITGGTYKIKWGGKVKS